jgi:hypothetical protein
MGGIMPQLVRLYITQVAFGFAVSAAFVFALVALDVGGIGHLVLGSDMGVVAALMLWVFHGVVFAGVQFAIAVMSLAEDAGPRGGLRQLIPIRVEAVATKRPGARR